MIIIRNCNDKTSTLSRWLHARAIRDRRDTQGTRLDIGEKKEQAGKRHEWR